MAKSKETKYKEAVERAIPNAGRLRKEAEEKTGKGLTDLQLKIKLGIRKDDNSYNKRIGI